MCNKRGDTEAFGQYSFLQYCRGLQDPKMSPHIIQLL